MNYVNICFVTEKGLKAKIIQCLTGCQYNHVYVEFFSREWKSWQAIEINERGVIQVPALSLEYPTASILKFTAKDAFSFALRERQDMIGSMYDWGGLLGGLFKLIIFRLFGRRIKKPWHSTGRYFCSEFVATILRASDSDTYKVEPWMSSVLDVLRYSRIHLEKTKTMQLSPAKR